MRLASLQVPGRAAYVSFTGTKFSGNEAPEDTIFLALKKASAEVPADWQHAVMQRTLATLGAGALATALGVGAAGDAGAPFASTGVSDSPEPEAGAAGVVAAGESVLEESEAPALTTAALMSILTSVALYFTSSAHNNGALKQKGTVVQLARWQCHSKGGGLDCTPAISHRRLGPGPRGGSIRACGLD